MEKSGKSFQVAKERLKAAEQLAAQMAARGGLDYLKAVAIDSKPEPRPFRLIARPWQWERARRLVPALDYVGGFTENYSGPLSFAETYPRGCDKTSFLGRMSNWLLAFGKKRNLIIAGAKDEDQAALITEAMKVEAGLNPWLWKRLKFYQKVVRGPGGELKIVTSDARSAFGLRGSIYLADEWTHWTKAAFWESLLSGRHKIPSALFFVIANAGLVGTWQWDLFQKMKEKGSGWSVFEAQKGIQTWMDPAQAEQDRKLMPAGQARRLFDNEWIDPAEESGYLTRPEVEACGQLGITLGLAPQTRGKPGREYVLSVDYGPKRDRTVLAVGHQEPTADSQAPLIVVDSMSVWQGSPDDPVKLAAVRAWLNEVRTAFWPCRLVIDPYQMEDIAQDLEQRMPVHRFEGRGGKSNYELAACLRSVIVNQQLAWYYGAGDLPLEGRLDTLTDELCSLVLRQMAYGYRIDHELTKHDDRAVCLGMLCLEILRGTKPAEWLPPAKLAADTVRPADQWKPREASRRVLYGVDWTETGGCRRFRP